MKIGIWKSVIIKSRPYVGTVGNCEVGNKTELYDKLADDYSGNKILRNVSWQVIIGLTIFGEKAENRYRTQYGYFVQVNGIVF